MKIEELENLWQSDQPVAPRLSAAADLSRQLEPELRRRSRFLAYEFFSLGLGLVLTPLLAVVNYRYRQPESPLLHWLNLALFMTVMIGYLVAAIRRWQRHRALARVSTASLAAQAAKAFAIADAEMQDYHTVQKGMGVCFVLALLGAYVNNPVTTHGWGPFGLRAGLTLLFLAGVGAVVWRHYRKNLVPEFARRKRLVEELAG